MTSTSSGCTTTPRGTETWTRCPSKCLISRSKPKRASSKEMRKLVTKSVPTWQVASQVACLRIVYGIHVIAKQLVQAILSNHFYPSPSWTWDAAEFSLVFLSLSFWTCLHFLWVLDNAFMHNHSAKAQFHQQILTASRAPWWHNFSRLVVEW